MSVWVYEKNGKVVSRVSDAWEDTILDGIETAVGEEGVVPERDKREGDKKTPRGVYWIDKTFGWGELPEGRDFLIQGIEHLKVSGPDEYFWVDDSESALYNQIYTGKDAPFSSAEDLYQPGYRYALVLSYNKERAPYRGSAIFVHVLEPGKTSTLGCIAYPEDVFLLIVAYLDIQSVFKIM